VLIINKGKTSAALRTWINSEATTMEKITRARRAGGLPDVRLLCLQHLADEAF